MGLSNSVSGTETHSSEMSLSPAESFACIALVAIAADGYLSEQEGQEMTLALSRMQLFSSHSADVMHRMFDKLLDLLKQYGPGELITQAKQSLPQELRETAFAIATDLVLSDGTVAPQEQSFLDDLYQILEVPGEVALQIVQVMNIKNRG